MDPSIIPLNRTGYPIMSLLNRTGYPISSLCALNITLLLLCRYEAYGGVSFYWTILGSSGHKSAWNYRWLTDGPYYKTFE
jgi:hypothetical protein